MLPVGSTRRLVAATQVVIFLVRVLGKTELDLLRRPLFSPGPAMPPELAGILFVATTVNLRVGDPAARDRLERLVRAWVEREYARQGIAPVEYDLQLVVL